MSKLQVAFNQEAKEKLDDLFQAFQMTAARQSALVAFLGLEEFHVEGEGGRRTVVYRWPVPAEPEAEAAPSLIIAPGGSN